jgi:glycosyltransferase involved in cell wall biosynthesis
VKIALCSPISLTNFSGAAKFLINAANLLASHGHDVEVHALPFGPNRNISLPKVQKLLTVAYYETWNVQVNADIAYINYIPLIWRRMKTNGLRVAGLHTHMLLPYQYLAETMLNPFKAGLEWYLKAIGFFAGLPLIKKDLLSFNAIHLPGGNIDVRGNYDIFKIPLWIDVNKIPPIKEKYKTFTILFAGRKTWEKGWFKFCEVVQRLKRMGYDFKFLSTGEGHNGIRGLGFLDENELFCVYKRSHVVIYPSIADIFGLVILEAAACGVPVVTTPLDVHVGQHLPLLYAEKPYDFVKAILYIHSIWKEHPKQYRFWSENLQSSVEKFHVDRIFPKFERMFDDIICMETSKSKAMYSLG